MKTLYSILFFAIVFSMTANAQELAPPFVIYTYDDAGNRVMTLSSPGYLEAEPTALLPILFKSSVMDELVTKFRAEWLSPDNTIHTNFLYAIDDRKDRRERQIKEDGHKQ